MAQLYATSTEITEKKQQISLGGIGPFTDNNGITSAEIVTAQVTSDHKTELFVVSTRPIVGTQDIEVTLNRDLNPGSDPVYPDNSRMLYAELHVIVVAPGGVYSV